MNEPVHPAVLRYVRREVSALRAAAEIGDDVSVSDVLELVKAAGLAFPAQDPEEADCELERARRVLGMTNDSRPSLRLENE